ncbi:hypothetical protein HMPREF9162_0785 [Selenomonas sp. oral taxon 137 str. F0430]|nr:hypothetical protein HMPREF9162_0785 [Selenomonas sp. oral taxon 137 str. F0430]EJP30239.1 hypothetical protein HMPREF1147_2180 [Selenomonas sp. FOBRC9]
MIKDPVPHRPAVDHAPGSTAARRHCVDKKQPEHAAPAG